MTHITTTAELFKPSARRGAAAALRLADAYGAVFTLRKPTKEDLDIVLVDLAEFTNYFFTIPDDAPETLLRAHNAKRAVFARILSLIALPLSQLDDLRTAALVELGVSNQEGDR